MSESNNLNEIFFRNEKLLVFKIENFHFLVNTFFSKGLKLINENQFRIFNSIDGKKTIQKISEELNFPVEDVANFLQKLQSLRMVNTENYFPEPNWNTSSPKSLNLWVHTTNKCNLTCYYCNIATLQSSGAMSNNTRNQLSEKLFQTAKERKLKSIKLRLSGGEPLLQFKHWKDFFISTKNKLKEIDCDFGISFLTNLTYLNDDIITFAKENKVGFGVSLDGFSEYHDLTRKLHNGKPTFSIVDENLRKLIANGIIPSVNTVISQDNMEGLPQLTKYLIDLNIHFRFSIVHGQGLDRNRLRNILLQCYDIMEDAIYEKDFKFGNKHKLCDLKPTDLSHHTCSSGFSSSAIYTDGNVYFCHVKFGSDDKSGSIFDEEDLVTTIQKGQYNLGEFSDECNNCQFKLVCTSGCPHYRENGKDLSCELYLKVLPRYYELLGIERLNKIKKYLEKLESSKILQ